MDTTEIMNTKVLDDILRSLGPMVGTDFNDQILGLIDIALLPLMQAGAIKHGSTNVTADTTWGDILNNPPNDLQYTPNDALHGVRSYMYFKVKLLFDPPASSLVQVLSQVADEELWRVIEMYDGH